MFENKTGKSKKERKSVNSSLFNSRMNPVIGFLELRCDQSL